MPTAAPKTAPLTLLYGQEFLVHQRARALVQERTRDTSEFGLEIIEGTAANTAEAVAVVLRVLEAVSTRPFLGGEKVVWLKDANFFGTDRTSEASDTLEAVAELTERLKSGLPEGVRLVVSATAMNRARSFFKTCEKLGEVVALLPPDERSREGQATREQFVEEKIRAAKKSLDEEGRERLLALLSGDLRQLDNELEKLLTYVGPRKAITAADVRAVVSPTRGAVVWDLTDAFGERDLPKALSSIENLLDRGENALGLLFALIGKTRSLLLLRDLLDRGVVEMPRFYSAPAMSSLAARTKDQLPPDRAFNPLLQHPFALFKNLQHAQQYSAAELAAAQSVWLDANQSLVSRSLDGKLTLQRALVTIMKGRP